MSTIPTYYMAVFAMFGSWRTDVDDDRRHLGDLAESISSIANKKRKKTRKVGRVSINNNAATETHFLISCSRFSRHHIIMRSVIPACSIVIVFVCFLFTHGRTDEKSITLPRPQNRRCDCENIIQNSYQPPPPLLLHLIRLRWGEVSENY